jgi:preprotein translocase subunit SecG
MTSTLFIVQIVLTVLITIVVLLQKSSSIGLGAYSGSNESVFGAKGPTGFLTKLTFMLSFLFIINTLALGYFYTKEGSSSVTDNIATTPSAPVAPITETIEAPEVPVAPTTEVSESSTETAIPVAPTTNNTTIETKTATQITDNTTIETKTNTTSIISTSDANQS